MKGDWGEGRHICQQFMEEHGTLVGFSNLDGPDGFT